ncbi:MAG TPA: error-prone DNA polymerase [Lacipirellulaceae bacterium]|nr:error-prone DNA polymerase [Lacipirellulaceae bacterium]
MRYAELHCKTNFSFLEGASHPDELVRRAGELDYSALAVTDRNSLAGVVRANIAAKEVGLPLVIGAEITPVDAPPVVLWATDRASYGRLCRLITRGRRQAPKGDCALALEDIAEFAQGLVAGVQPPALPGVINETHADNNNANCKLQIAEEEPPAEPGADGLLVYHDIFKDRCYLLAELHYGVDDAARLAEFQALARTTGIPLVAAGDVHYHVPVRMVLHDVLTAIRHGTTVAAGEGMLLFPNAERHLRPVEEIRAIFAAAPEAIARTTEIAERCRFSLDELRYEYPTELAPKGQTPLEYLTQLTWQGAAERYPAGVPEKVSRQIEYELELVRDLRYESYFLTVWDLVRFARSKNILCQGRGSAANSAVCYCLGVTSVDPATCDLLFERFVSRERNEAPDIDIDFEHERREEVLQYVYEKYGRERAGLAATVITYCSRSAIRDVGKALGLSLDRVDALAKHVEGYTHEPKLVGRAREVGVDPASDLGRRLVYCVNEIIGFPRHLSQHVGGMVMTQGPLCEMVPIENAAMEDRTVIEWDKDDLDELGILKVDCLCLGMLTAIHKCFDLVRDHHGRELTLASVPKEDSDVYDMICRADTIGVFQIESRAQMSMLPRLKPRRFYDLVIEVAIVRPGPIQGNMVHPYLRRRAGEEQETYPNDAIRQVLEKTLGVPIFQEQAMRLAVVAAGFTPGEADQLRRAMAAWRRPGLIDQFRKKLLDGMRANNLPEEFAQRVYRQIEGFGEYGFPESHAASFALLVYTSAWLKHHYPAAFAAAMINSQPMGFYQPAQLVRDARDHGVAVRPVDVNFSCWDCTLESQQPPVPPGVLSCAKENEHNDQNVCMPIKPPAEPGAVSLFLRLGLCMIGGLRETHGKLIEQVRAGGAFTSIDDFARRTGLGQAVIKRLAEADAFGSVGTGRRQALWHALGQEKKRRAMPLFEIPPLPSGEGRGKCARIPRVACPRAFKSTAGQASSGIQEPQAPLPAMQLYEEVVADYRTAGLSLRAHPISFYRDQLERLGITPARQLVELKNSAPVRVAGLVLLRQRPGTAKGITFVTLEDETGTVNLVVHQHTWDRYYRIARRAPAWIVHGHIQTTTESFAPVIHVVVARLEALAEQLQRLDVKARDFR